MKATMKSEMGGPGSGPKPGHRSPWYERGSKGKPKGSGTADDPIVTSDVEEAARALAEDKYVQLNQPDEVATLLDELAANVAEAKAAGEDAPDYNLCHVSVPGTNLFCVESKGIPRIKMPQLSGVPTPGSPADALPKDSGGGVDLGPAFVEHMRAQGVDVATKNVPASHLRASQNELSGAKVAGISNAIEDGSFVPADATPIFVTSDNYVVDGHHRWAATIGAEYATGGDIEFPVNMLDTDIITALAMANDFASDMGLAPKAMVEFGGPGSGPKPGVKSPWYDRPSRPRPHTPGNVPQLPSDNPDESRIMAAAPKPTDPEAYAIDQYTGPAFREINAHFRKGAELSDEMAETVADLETYINHSRLPDCTLYRGMTLMPEDTAKLEVGGTVTDPGFMSTTYDRKNRLIQDRNVELHLNVEAGTNGAWLGYATRHPGDQEVLFNPGTSYRISSVTEDPTGRLIVNADVVNDRPPLSVDEIQQSIRGAKVAALDSVFGGPGSGPRPGHRSPWYERGKGAEPGVGEEPEGDADRPEADDAEVAPNPSASPLAEDYELYFSNMDDSVLVPIGQLDAQKPPESQPKSVEKAEDFMSKASRGETGKRDPISVSDTGDGRYKILDGNATYGAAMKSGWNAMPVNVMTEQEHAQAEADKKAAGATASVFGGPGSGPKPGHRSPWYDRGKGGSKKVKGKLGTKHKKLVGKLKSAAPRPKAIWKDKLAGGPVDQLAILKQFGQMNGKINEQLRLGRGDVGSEFEKTTNGLNEYLNSAEIPEDITVYRAMDLDPSVAKAVLPGSQFQNPGFTSTSLLGPDEPDSPMKGAGLIVEISVPKGTKGAYVSEYTGGTDEVLFPTDMNVRVDSRDGDVVKASLIDQRLDAGVRVPRGGLIVGEAGAPIEGLPAAAASAFGGPGSGPKPGHRSPWYQRGKKAKGKLGGGPHEKLVGKLKDARPPIQEVIIPGAPNVSRPVDQTDLLGDFVADEAAINERLRLAEGYGDGHDWSSSMLNDYLNSAEIPEDITVYRAMDLDPSVAKAVLPGSQFQNPGFTSTSLVGPDDPDSPVIGADLIVEISGPAGTRGVYVGDYTGGTDEVLFPTDMNVRVDSRDGDIVRATVIDSRIEDGIKVPRGGLVFGDELVEGIAAAAFGGPGSGPRPGHRSPWYERGSKAKGGKRSYGGYELDDPDNPPAETSRPSDVIDAAKTVRDAAGAAEPAITQAMIDTANDNGGTMVGLPFRMKTEKSIARKVDQERGEYDGDSSATAQNMSDVIRYTTTFEDDNYIAGMNDMINDLDAEGYQLRVKNYWAPGDPYQGVNVAAVDPTGQRFELQFHTPASVTAKEPIHEEYVKYRESKDPAERRRLYDYMVGEAAKIPVPGPLDELLTIGEVKYQPFTPY